MRTAPARPRLAESWTCWIPNARFSRRRIRMRWCKERPQSLPGPGAALPGPRRRMASRNQINPLPVRRRNFARRIGAVKDRPLTDSYEPLVSHTGTIKVPIAQRCACLSESTLVIMLRQEKRREQPGAENVGSDFQQITTDENDRSRRGNSLARLRTGTAAGSELESQG